MFTTANLASLLLVREDTRLGAVGNRDWVPATCPWDKWKPVLVNSMPCFSQQTFTDWQEERKINRWCVSLCENCSTAVLYKQRVGHITSVNSVGNIY